MLERKCKQDMRAVDMKSYENILDLKIDLNNKTQFLILVYIMLFSTVRLKDLADFLKNNFGLTKGAIYQNLNFLLENGFIRRLSDIEALKYRSENRRIIPSIFESTTKVRDMSPFDEAELAKEDNVKRLMELALISINKEEALNMCWNALWFLAAIESKARQAGNTQEVISFFRKLREQITAGEITFE
jgi:DNA-binding MarR family transcriptional regulator